MGVAGDSFAIMRKNTVAFVFDHEHHETGLTNLEILDAGGIDQIQKMTDPSGAEVLVLSISNKDGETSHFGFQDMSGIGGPVSLATDVLIRTELPDSFAQYGGITAISPAELEGYDADPTATVVDRELMQFTQQIVQQTYSTDRMVTADKRVDLGMPIDRFSL